MLKFYQWLKKWAAQKTKDHVRCNIKCPVCRVWSSEIDGEIIQGFSWGYKFKCGQCGQEQLYNTAAFPFPCISDENGNPLVDAEYCVSLIVKCPPDDKGEE